jgi:hypothetical protein
MNQKRDPRKIQNILISISILLGALFFLSSRSDAQDTIGTFRAYHPTDTSQTGNSTFIVQEKPDTQSQSSQADTMQATRRHKWIPQPQRATILSAVLPGLGQAYNRKYWKIPILYSAGGALYYYYKINNDAYLENRRNYELEVAKGTEADAALQDKYSREYTKYQKKRDYKVILAGVLYVANIVDAMADAYFATYDISDDLSFKIKPSISSQPYLTMNTISYGFTLSLHF